MAQVKDHDGKSKSASAADEKSYADPASETPAPPTHADIATRAHQLWMEQGQPSDCAERIWLDAERELQSTVKSRSLLEKVQQHAGSVQP
jgi:hypothetical protein